MDKIKQIELAISDGAILKSKLEGNVLNIGGFTSPKIRHTLNNLGGLVNSVFEIGSHRGATACSIIYKNKNIDYVQCVDNFSEFEDGTVRIELLRHLTDYSPCEWDLIENNCFNIQNLFFQPEFYLYDGLHSDWAQREALIYFYSMLPNEFIFCADDYDWNDVMKGTQEGIKACNFKILFDQHLKGKDGYHNGFYISLLQK